MTVKIDRPLGVRRAGLADAEGLQRQPFGALAPAMPGENPDWRKCLVREDCYVYVLEAEHIEGVIAVQPMQSTLMEGQRLAELLVWYLTEHYRQQGLGRKLLIHAGTVAKRLGCDQLLLWLTKDQSERAIKVAVRAGFLSVMSRETNNGQGVKVDQGYALNLEDYF